MAIKINKIRVCNIPKGYVIYQAEKVAKTFPAASAMEMQIETDS